MLCLLAHSVTKFQRILNSLILFKIELGFGRSGDRSSGTGQYNSPLFQGRFLCYAVCFCHTFPFEEPQIGTQDAIALSKLIHLPAEFVYGDSAPVVNETRNHPWYALRTKPRHEAVAAMALGQKGYETLLPLYKSKRTWSDRTKVIDLPLFPGYLFCRFDPQYQLPIVQTPGVISVLSFVRTPAVISENEIASIRTLMGSGMDIEPWPYLGVGQTVRIEDGPLQDVEGIVVQLKKKQRLVVSVSLLQRSVAVEIDRYSITPVSPQRRAS